MKKIIVESHIPYIKGLIEPLAEVAYLEPQEFTPQSVADADALVIRTRTQCNAALLAGSKVQFIGTATIGTDHIDLDYCATHGIAVHNAPGCNAPAVAQYVHSTIGHWLLSKGMESAEGLTLGIVGVGHVGSIVARWADQLGFKVLLNDPPRQQKEQPSQFVSLKTIAERSDFITIHTPLCSDGEFATHHLINSDFLEKANRCRLLINAARGPIADNLALREFAGDVAIDCWENEPAIDPILLAKAFVATPHIAGYSQEGKMRGTAMVIDALNKHFGWNISPTLPTTPADGCENVDITKILESYDPLADTKLLKNGINRFESLRNHYALRHEVGFVDDTSILA